MLFSDKCREHFANIVLQSRSQIQLVVNLSRSGMVGTTKPYIMNNSTVYHTFQARDLHSNKFVEYRVQDFPRNRYEEGIQYMIQNFFEHEAMGKTRKIKSDRKAVEGISEFWREMLPKGFSIACFKENSDDIIAMNILDVSSINDPKDDSKVN
jgi:hypothetical protein